MGILHQMEDEIDCVEVIFQNYILSRRTNDIYLFFEGKDDFKYYWARLSPFVLQSKYKKYVCLCKSNVLELHDMIKTRTRNKENESLLYFVDNDFDKKIYDMDIYVTPTYAIENLYISDNAFSNILKGEWGLSSEMEDDDKEDYEVAYNYLISNRNAIIDQMLYANAWYSLQYNMTNSKQCPKLTALKNFEAIKNVNKKQDLEKLVPNYFDVSEEAILEEMKYLREKAVERLRGKYFEQTMAFYFRKVFEDSNKKSDREMFKKRRKVNINIGVDNMVSVLSNYADVPVELITYIKTQLCKKEFCA